MSILIAGPGQGLQLPQNLYPTELFNAPYDIATNYVMLSPADALVIPAGRWFIDVGAYSVLQYLDPVTGAWRNFPSARGQGQVVLSDGFTRRIANLTGCPIAAIIENGGTGFSSSSATITANVGGSTWEPVVGGALSITSITVAGSGFTMAPLVFIPAPPSPGIQATAYATLTGTSVTGITLTNVGGGYNSAPTISILPNPSDPNFGSITAAQATCALTNAGEITGALCTNNGASLVTLSALTLTAAGGSGAGASIVPVIMQTVKSTTIVSGGVGLGTVADPAKLLTVGGVPTTASAIGNPAVELTSYRPRSLDGEGICNAGGTITSIVLYDSGLFAGTPSVAIAPGAGEEAPTNMGSITLTMGGLPDTVLLQPL